MNNVSVPRWIRGQRHYARGVRNSEACRRTTARVGWCAIIQAREALEVVDVCMGIQSLDCIRERLAKHQIMVLEPSLSVPTHMRGASSAPAAAVIHVHAHHQCPVNKQRQPLHKVRRHRPRPGCSGWHPLTAACRQSKRDSPQRCQRGTRGLLSPNVLYKYHMLRSRPPYGVRRGYDQELGV